VGADVGDRSGGEVAQPGPPAGGGDDGCLLVGAVGGQGEQAAAGVVADPLFHLRPADQHEPQVRVADRVGHQPLDAQVPEADASYAPQLAVYTDAGRREGLDVRAAYVHDLKAADRQPVDVSACAIATAEEQVEASVRGLPSRDFRAKPGRPCLRCDQKRLCPWDATAQQAVV
jgi:PD-(D/E)XK nuclease superfamily